MAIHVLVVVSMSVLIGIALIFALLDLANGRERLRHERRCVERLVALYQKLSPDSEPFATELKNITQGKPIVAQLANEAYRTTLAGGQINVASFRERVENELQNTPSFARQVANLSVYFGLMGTLIGLAFAVMALHQIPPIEGPEDLKAFGNVTRDMFGSFGMAFVSAAAGILATLVTGASLSWYDKKSFTVGDKVESLFSEFILPSALTQQIDSRPVPTDKEYQRLLRQFLSASEQTVGKIQDSAALLQSVCHKTHETVEMIGGAAGAMADSSRALASMTSGASESLKNVGTQIAEETRGSFADLSSNIGQLSEAASRSANASQKLESLVDRWDTKPLQEAANKFGTILPALETKLAGLARDQKAELTQVLDQIKELLSSTNVLVREQAVLVTEVERIVRPIGNTVGSQSEQHLNQNSKISETVDLLRQILSELSGSAQPKSISNSSLPGERSETLAKSDQLLASSDLISELRGLRLDLAAALSVRAQGGGEVSSVASSNDIQLLVASITELNRAFGQLTKDLTYRGHTNGVPLNHSEIPAEQKLGKKRWFTRRRP